MKSPLPPPMSYEVSVPGSVFPMEQFVSHINFEKQATLFIAMREGNRQSGGGVCMNSNVGGPESETPWLCQKSGGAGGS